MSTPKTNSEKKSAKMAEELKTLLLKRGQVKAKLTRVWRSVEEAGDDAQAMTLPQLRVHSRSVEKYYGEFNDIHDKAIPLVPEDQREAQDEKLFEFEDLYNQVCVAIETMMDSHGRDGNHHQAGRPIGSAQAGQPQIIVHQQALRAPLPTFDGRYENWAKFKSMFQDLMRNSPDSDGVKLYHLEKSLIGGAAGIIDAKTLQDNNYQQAWRTLEERFENKRLIIDIHLQGIMQLKKMSKKSSKDLRELIDECSRHVENLRFHKQELLGVSELFVVHILSAGLDRETRELWEATIEHGELPKYAETMEFLKKRCLILERCESANVTVSSAKPAASKTSPFTKTSAKVSAAVTNPSVIVCELCGGPHPNFKCNPFRSMSVAQRMAKVKEANIYFNCLRKGHRSSSCPSERTCSKCQGRHHSMLHPETSQSQQIPKPKVEVVAAQENVRASGSTSSEMSGANPPVASTCCSNGLLQSTQQVLLQTAIIDVVDSRGFLHPCRTLLDSGSQAHILSERMAKLLGLPTIKCNVTVIGANAVKTEAKKGLWLNFSSRYSSFKDNIPCLLSERPAGTVPSARIDVSSWNIPSDLRLADPRFSEPSEIDLVLASNYVWEVLRSDKLRLSNDSAALRETDFGWIITGTYDPYQHVSSPCFLSNVAMSDPLKHAIERFWTIEELPDSPPVSNDEQEAEQHFRETHHRDKEGRFVVQLPFRDSVAELSDNRALALKRFGLLERRLQRNPDLKGQYAAFIEDYEALGHCKEVFEEKDELTKGKFYLPHHAVLKPTSSSTKLRVVFDASAKSSKFSLNDVLLVGPTVQNDLFSIVLRFRRHKYAFSADVAKMYRQVRVDETQTPFQRIFWRKEPSDRLRVLELTTVTYGTACAPFLATRCLVQLAETEQQRFPDAANAVKNDMYVDDMLSGADTEEEALKLQTEVKQLLAEAGFPIRKWCSNSNAVLENVPVEDRETLVQIEDCTANKAIKALGVIWDPQDDNFRFVAWPCENSDNPVTKRFVLSDIAKLFDPLGLVSPVVVLAKIIMQKLWADHLNWDDELQGDILREWMTFRSSLPAINQIVIPRCVTVNHVIRYELHGFSDASAAAYGACIYLRSIREDGSAELRLLCAKSRVAPLKQTTIPRMELLAAVVLARLAVKVIATLQLELSQVVLWSDSQIVLAWLRKSLTSLEILVRNRVVEINNLTADFTWKYVRTDVNPADIVSRGQLPVSLHRNDLWWNGPKFLRDADYAMADPAPILDDDLPELKTVVATPIAIGEPLPVFTRFSNFRKLQRVIAYVRRFIHNCQSRVTNQAKMTTSYVTVPECRAALRCIVKVIQRSELSTEIESVERNQPSRRLAGLSPILEGDGLLRVGGRLQNSKLPRETIHPIILPSHPMTESLIRSFHVENLHIGPTGLLAAIRQRFWLLNGRNTVRNVTRRCLSCFRVKPHGIQQFMGNLPAERVNVAAPFEFCGVDFAGPVTVKQGKYRPKHVKGYIAVFVCLSTKNIHLELVSDLSTEAFLAALERFINRRGFVRKIFSDNATNFAGAANQLRELYRLFNDECHRHQLNDFLLPKEIEWCFIPPRAPNFGGLWEAGVKSVKTHLKRTLQNAILTFEEFATILTKVEAILNSRPLFSLPDNPDDPSPITPAHLQIGRPLQGVPMPSCLGIPDNRLTRWQYLNKLREQFWGRWSREYLTTLQTRSKWTTKSTNIQPGMVVLLVEDNVPPQTWKYGIIVATHPGKDSLVRVADIRTATGVVFRRSISKLAPLPIEDNERLQLPVVSSSSASQPRGRMSAVDPLASNIE